MRCWLGPGWPRAHSPFQRQHRPHQLRTGHCGATPWTGPPDAGFFPTCSCTSVGRPPPPPRPRGHVHAGALLPRSLGTAPRVERPLPRLGLVTCTRGRSPGTRRGCWLSSSGGVTVTLTSSRGARGGRGRGVAAQNQRARKGGGPGRWQL